MGDLFNYDAPGVEPSDIENLEPLLSNISIPDTILLNGDNNIMVDAEQLDSHSLRLTDGGFQEDVNAYCFYARAHYKKGDQVIHKFWKFLMHLVAFHFYFVYLGVLSLFPLLIYFLTELLFYGLITFE